MVSKPSDIIPTNPVYDPDAHYQRVLGLYESYPIKNEATAEKLALRIVRHALQQTTKSLDDVTEDFLAAVVSTLETMLDADRFVHQAPPHRTSIRSFLDREEHLLSTQRLEFATENLQGLCVALFQFFPAEVFSWSDAEDDSGIPLISLMPQAVQVVDGLCRGVIQCTIPRGDENLPVFPQSTKQITNNILLANGLTPDSIVKSNKTIKFPSDFNLEPVEYVDRFLHETSFQFLLKLRVKEPPMPPIPDALKFEHTWCLAAPGAGKTTLILKEIVDNLKRDNPPAMVILDPKGTITPQISKLAVFDPISGKHRDRLIIIDPTDVTSPPAINMFHPGNAKRFRVYSEAMRRQVENQAITLFSYVFASRGNALTPQQGTCFDYLVRLLFSIEKATIHTMLDIINDQLYDRQPSVDRGSLCLLCPRPVPNAGYRQLSVRCI